MTRRLKNLLHDIRGSEVIEFVGSTAVCCFLILSFMMILGYAVQADALTRAGKQIARKIEVEGIASDVNYVTYKYTSPTSSERVVSRGLTSFIYGEADKIGVVPNANDINLEYWVEKDGAKFVSGDPRIQLDDKFTVVIKADYIIKVSSVGSDAQELKMPIVVRIDGQSEVYWKDLENDRNITARRWK